MNLYRTVVGQITYSAEFDKQMARTLEAIEKEELHVIKHHFSAGGGIISCMLELSDSPLEISAVPSPEECQSCSKYYDEGYRQGHSSAKATEISETKNAKPARTAKNKTGKGKTAGGEATA